MTELTVFLIFIVAVSVVTAFTFSRNNLKLRKKMAQQYQKLTNSSVSVDEIKERYQKAHKKLETFSVVVRETDNAVILMDKEGNFEWVNQGFIRLFGLNLEQLIKQRGKNILENSDNPEVRGALGKCIHQKHTVRYESQCLSAENKKIWTYTTLTPILNKKNEIIRLVAIDSNITKVKEAEEQIARQRDELEKINQELKTVADQDGLTGIANHRRFSDFFSREWQRALRDNRPIALVLADVDFFKLFNDTYGRQAGDQCLRDIAQALHNLISRPGDLVARYGGEEFAIVLSDTPLRGAVIVAERMRHAIEELGIRHKSSKIAEVVTISLGCARQTPSRNISKELILRQADKALYQAKKDGRNRISVAG